MVVLSNGKNRRENLENRPLRSTCCALENNSLFNPLLNTAAPQLATMVLKVLDM